MTRVKICGITNLADAICAAEAGASLLGFVFYPPSPRYVAPAQAREIIAALRASGASAQTVGVFVNEPVPAVRQVSAECALDLIQLHGDEPPQSVRALGPRAFKALRLRDSDELAARIAKYGGVAKGKEPALLIDAYHPDHFGGTGQRADWRIAGQIARDFPILLAGGLSAENVAEAIRQVHPWGVDVSSGVERAPGMKDHQQVRQFIRNVNMACQRGTEEME